MASQQQELIAKELTLALIEKGQYMGLNVESDEDAISFNKRMGESIGELYSALLTKVVESDQTNS